MAIIKCAECGKEVSDQAAVCVGCGSPIAKPPEAAKHQGMVCPKCNSTNVIVSAVAEKKKRGCIMSCFWILLAICTLGAIIWIPLLTRKGSKTVTYAICQSCGKRWKA